MFLFLLLGAIINIIVAWGMDIADQPTLTQIAKFKTPAVAPNVSSLTGHLEIWAKPLEKRAWRANGWPFASMLRQDRSSTFDDPDYWRDGWEISGFATRPLDRNPVILPLLPSVCGFPLNTAFYTSVLCFVFLVPFEIRRWRRVQRGLCPKCAYPIGIGDTCTECGGAVKPKLELENKTSRARQEAGLAHLRD